MKEGDPSIMGDGDADEGDEDEDEDERYEIRLRAFNSSLNLARTALDCSSNSATTPSFIIFQIYFFF